MKIQSRVLCCLVVLLLLLQGASAATAALSNVWPTFGGNIQRTGYVPITLRALDPNSTVTVPNVFCVSPPIISEEYALCITMPEYVEFGPCAVVAVSLATQQVAWSTTIASNYCVYDEPPPFYDAPSRTVIAQIVLNFYPNNISWSALQTTALSVDTGSPLWNYTVDYEGHSVLNFGLASYDGLVFLTTYFQSSPYMLALHISNGTMAWKASCEHVMPEFELAPTVAVLNDGSVEVLWSSPGTTDVAVCSASARNGQIELSIPKTSQNSPWYPVYGGGEGEVLLLFGMNASGASTLIAYSLAHSATLWQYPVAVGAIAVTNNDRVFAFGLDAGSVVELNLTTGALLSTIPAASLWSSSYPPTQIVATDDSVLLYSFSGLMQWDRIKQRWTTMAPIVTESDGVAIAAEHRVVVATVDEGMVFIWPSSPS